MIVAWGRTKGRTTQATKREAVICLQDRLDPARVASAEDTRPTHAVAATNRTARRADRSKGMHGAPCLLVYAGQTLSKTESLMRDYDSQLQAASYKRQRKEPKPSRRIRASPIRMETGAKPSPKLQPAADSCPGLT